MASSPITHSGDVVKHLVYNQWACIYFVQYQIKISTFLSNCNIYISHYVYIIVLSVNFSYLEINDYLFYRMQTVWIT